VRLSADRLEIQTIGGEPAVGILRFRFVLDVIAQLRINNVLDRSGRMGAHARVQTRDGGGSEFVLAERRGQEPITVSQKDVREMQLAKAAIRLGIQALAAAEGIEETEIERVIIAGAVWHIY